MKIYRADIILLPLALLYGCAASGLGMPDGDTYREVWSKALEENWRRDGRTAQADPDFFQCLVDETMATFTPADLGRLDVFVATRNPDLQSEANAILANRDARIGGDLEAYVAPKCGHLTGE